MLKISSYLLVLSTLCFTVISCQQNPSIVFDQYQETEGVWVKEDIKAFVYEAKDTVQDYDLFMNIRANKDYPFSNIFVILKMYQPNNDIVVDTLQFQMAMPDGTLLGTGFTDVKENKLWMKERFRFPESGNYKFTIEQVVRELGQIEGIDALNGISEVGFRIEKSE